jgi:hypothetical protein
MSVSIELNVDIQVKISVSILLALDKSTFAILFIAFLDLVVKEIAELLESFAADSVSQRESKTSLLDTLEDTYNVLEHGFFTIRNSQRSILDRIGMDPDLGLPISVSLNHVSHNFEESIYLF